jgi:hypothetical protein
VYYTQVEKSATSSCYVVTGVMGCNEGAYKEGKRFVFQLNITPDNLGLLRFLG